MEKSEVVFTSAIQSENSTRRRGKGYKAQVPAPSSSSSRVKVESSAHDVEVQLLPEEDRHRTPLATTWLYTRLEPNGTYRPKGEDRPLTLGHIRLAIQLVKLLWIPFLRLFWEGQRLRVAGFLGRRLIKGVLPAARLWAQSKMLDVVQQSFEAGQAGTDTAEVLRIATLSLVLTAGEDIYNYLSRTNDQLIRTHINYKIERAYLSAQLSLSIPAMSHPHVMALMYEAGVFAGLEPRSTRSGLSSGSSGAFDTLQSIFALLTISVEVVTQLALLLRTLAGTSQQWSPASILLIALSLAPPVLRLAGSWMFGRNKTTRRLGWNMRRRKQINVKDIARKGEYRQEVVLFGLKDWVLAKWEQVMQEQQNERSEMEGRFGIVELGLGLGQQSVETAFYVLLALRAIPTSLSLGSIRLYQSTAASLLSSIRQFTRVLEQAFQSIFYLAAFVEATSDPESLENELRIPLIDAQGNPTPLLDYEQYRVEGGMSIEAVDLSFTYPGATKPTLSNINLFIPAGTTLAIVGFNGGGKTTLVKALMGLYGHSGTLLINGHPAETYDPHSLHARTSCLFQDFSKYSLTLRENVGVGAVDLMDDTERILTAIERGGAGKVRDKIGLEGALNRNGVPNASEEEITTDPEKQNDTTQGQDEGQMMPPPRHFDGGGPGRGGGPGGRGGGLMGGGGGGGRPHGPPPGPPPGDGFPPFPPPPGMMDGGDGGPPPFPPGQEPRSSNDVKIAALSGGQWQRVALSRAFLRADQADLVVFDEPSASLDPRAEVELFQRIHALSTTGGGRKCTTIYISHRFSTVRRADMIAVVEDGTIVEVGSHTELMEYNDRYHELFNFQKEGFEG